MYTIGDGSVLDYLHHLILPSLVLSLVHVAIWSRYMRTATLDALSQDFVKTARAKGLSERRILLKHVVGNALLPMITLGRGATAQHSDRRIGHRDRLYLAGNGTAVPRQPRLQRLSDGHGAVDILSRPGHVRKSGRRHRRRYCRPAHSLGLKALSQAYNRRQQI